MSFCLFDSKGYVGDLGTNSGCVALMDFLNGKAEGEVKSFSESGRAKLTASFLKELGKLEAPKDKNIKTSFDNLKKMVRESKGFIYISNGLDD